MNHTILREHISDFIEKSKKEKERFTNDYKERIDHIAFYQSYNKEKMLNMSEEDIYKYISKLWAMLIWGNKKYYIDKIIDDNGIKSFRKELAELVWGTAEIEQRWDGFRNKIKGMGPAMISEILCKTNPNDFMIWNRRALVGLRYLEVDNLPRYDYQVTGKIYKHLCLVSREIAEKLKKAGVEDTSLLAVDYFIWDELQVEENLSRIHDSKDKKIKTDKLDKPEESQFIHNDIRDKLRDIGQWLGFDAKIEQKVAEGSKVDTIWEATIGNMGRVIYVFEVQTKGSIDSLIVNLLKSLNNPAVQGVVAVSDKLQIEKIKKHAEDVKNLNDKLRFWDYEEVLKVHESMEFTNAAINNLGLVPQGF